MEAHTHVDGIYIIQFKKTGTIYAVIFYLYKKELPVQMGAGLTKSKRGKSEFIYVIKEKEPEVKVNKVVVGKRKRVLSLPESPPWIDKTSSNLFQCLDHSAVLLSDKQKVDVLTFMMDSKKKLDEKKSLIVNDKTPLSDLLLYLAKSVSIADFKVDDESLAVVVMEQLIKRRLCTQDLKTHQMIVLLEILRRNKRNPYLRQHISKLAITLRLFEDTSKGK
ncbi:hypothetical protein ACOME3_005736 [Neoechinorhynchus agilis]